MKKVLVNQVGFLCNAPKKAVLNFQANEFSVVDGNGKKAFDGKVEHFGTDEISGEDTNVADFSALTEEGKYKIVADGQESVLFTISNDAYDKLMKDICKCFYYLRCGDALSKEFAGEYYHKPCHMTKATVYGEEVEPVDVTGGWHDAGDYGRYSTAGAVAVAHLLYGVRFFKGLLDVHYDIPKVAGDKGNLPEILAEVKVELDFLMKMQRENGSVWHKVTTFNHAPFLMPEDDREELFLFSVSSLATADIAAVFALAYTVYKDYDAEYADKLMQKSLLAYKWLLDNPDELLFFNPDGSNTGQYDEAEDISNRFWAACALYEATSDGKYYSDAQELKNRLEEFDKYAQKKGYQGNVFTCLGWAEVAGLGSLSLLLKREENALCSLARNSFVAEADRLVKVSKENGFGLCMGANDFIWGSNMELLKYMMILSTAIRIDNKPEYKLALEAGLDYILGCNSMDISYVTGNGEKAFKNPHLRPTAVDDIEEPWPGLVSGGPNSGLHDERAQTLRGKGLPPMKCYIDHVDCYSLNEITIYWNSPLVFALSGILE
ncbi:cellodextrinase Cel9B [Butyrivibrio proteoclasticus B316]|uniref:Endoglucanase n=1 Tax=Butyrivibrio proteoclasticus (strain ATCC 51982 / DSM 14932 / B316) TaxID=515622 RepID=E0RV60_BUTPB|nr:glycoside hydrolase family 9 protein [Butyrivibrio proteoclasticus]ADL34330.1 cellodextrinase Cel9B [Butyrivibrio proteoclasticus B316]